MYTVKKEIEIKDKIEKIIFKLFAISFVFTLICLSISLYFFGFRFKFIFPYLQSYFFTALMICIFYLPPLFFFAFFKKYLKLDDWSWFELEFLIGKIFLVLFSHFLVITNLDVLLYQLKLTEFSITHRIFDTIISFLRDQFTLYLIFFLSPLILIVIFVITKETVDKENKKKKEFNQKIQVITEKLRSDGWVLISEWDKSTQIAEDFKVVDNKDWVKIKKDV